MTIKAQIIDVFAGPGGLGEGFSAYTDAQGNFPFQISISVEMEQYAHKTLRLRAFIRHFIQQSKPLPAIYLDYVTGKDSSLGKMLEFRQFDGGAANGILTENDTRDWDKIGPKHYCPKVYDDAKKKYKKNWPLTEEAMRKALFEARRMTLGPDKVEIHQAIEQQKIKELPIILIGGPPCQAFSTVGRSRRKGHVINHVVHDEDGNGEWNQNDDGRTWLYKEYIKIIHEFQPDIFVMENVRGMLSAKITDDEGDKIHVWKRIFTDLHQPAKALDLNCSGAKYDIYSLATNAAFKGDTNGLKSLDGSGFVLHAEEYGIPQSRERVILLGVRRDISQNLRKEFVSYLTKIEPSQQTHVQDAIDDLPALRAGVGCVETYDVVADTTSRRSINAGDEKAFWLGPLKDSLQNMLIKLECITVDHQQKVRDILGIAHQGHAKAVEKPRVATYANDACESTASSMSKFSSLGSCRVNDINGDRNKIESVIDLKRWYRLNKNGAFILNHATRNHMDTDLCRYIYSASFTLVQPENNEKTFPRLPELEEVGLEPKGHKNKVSFIDRFRTQVWNMPATTVTSHISKDGHYYIHPDPSQMRSLTVREVARIQTFPDNYFFEGPRTAQFVQVGNAVPPMLARKVAEIVNDIFVTIKQK